MEMGRGRDDEGNNSPNDYLEIQKRINYMRENMNQLMEGKEVKDVKENITELIYSEHKYRKGETIKVRYSK